MRKTILTVCVAAFLFASCGSKKDDDKKTGEASKESTNEGKSEEAWVPIDSATMMQKMMEYGTPGEMHKMMASWDGTWNGDMSIWEYDGATATKQPGIAVNSMIMGGKYQTSTHTGQMMGMPFEGKNILAYDNASKKFQSSWIDTWSTGIMNMSGDWDEATKSMTLTGSMPDMCRPGKECHYREVFKVIDDNTHHMEMYGPDPKTGKEFKMMEIHMTRKK